MQDKIFIQDLEVRCIVGIFDWERKVRQKILIDLEFPANIKKAAIHDHIQDTIDYKKISKRVIDFVAKSRFFLIETLAETLAQLLLKEFKLAQIKLRVSKPGALRGSRNVGLEIIRTRK